MQLTLQIPDVYFVNKQPQSLAKQIKLYTALMMYSIGQVSAGAACEIADIDRYSFNEACSKHNIPVISYNIDEIEEEVQQYQTVAL